MMMLVNSTPDQIPADEIAEQLHALGEKTEGVEVQPERKDITN